MSFFSRSMPVCTDEHLVDELLSRGVAEVIVKSDLRKRLLSGERLRIKFGIDPTSPNLHIGRAVPILKLRDFQKLGHTVVFIVGDFTAVIGDTSDKDAERPMLTREVIEKNKKSYFEQVGKIIDLKHAETYYNSAWLEKLTYREIGEHADMFSLSDFIARDNIARRLSGGKRVSLREVLYPLMQGHDSVAINADVELGGMDQKFNILAGRTMQEKMGQRPQNIILNPLIEGLNGRKMSSSWGNTIVLTATPADMYGKVMSISDTHIGIYFELCTRVPMKEVEEIRNSLADNSLHHKEAKMRLARDIVTLHHSVDDAKKAEESWVTAFSEGGVPADVLEILVVSGTTLLEVLASLGDSKTELRRLATAGAISEIGGEKANCFAFSPVPKASADAESSKQALGGEKLTDLTMPIKTPITIRIGKHRFLRVVIKE